MKIPPPLDVHAHISPDASEKDMRGLGAFIFAMTRSVDEFGSVSARRDVRVAWGLGVHPGLVGAQKRFDADEFTIAIRTAPFVGEVGLDGQSRVPMATQLGVFRKILGALQEQPRLVSVHSHAAQIMVLRELHRTPVDGVVLHWWTGSEELTSEALRLGCYFSIPPIQSSSSLLKVIPKERVLTETDHPSGDRRTARAAPGQVRRVEQRLAEAWSLPERDVRLRLWQNLDELLRVTASKALFADEWRKTLDGVCGEKT